MARAMPDSGPIARRAAADALIASTQNIRETGKNRGEYIDVYNRTAGAELGSPYCASFFYTRLKKAAVVLGKTIPKDFDGRAYTPVYRIYGLARQLWIPIADAKESPVHRLQVGDAALFYYADLGRIGHIEVVTGLWKEDGVVLGVRTVGANTGPDKDDKVERNGDGVYAKKRRWQSFGARGGFTRLTF